jgi:hypothetical protein
MIASAPEAVLKDPIRDMHALGSGDEVGVAVMDSNVHARIIDLRLGLRKAVEAASLSPRR